MRSTTGPVLAILGLAGGVILALLLLQTIGLRGDLSAARDEVVALQAQVDGLERGVPMSELSMRMGELENDIQDWVVAFGGEVPSGGDSSPAGGTVTNAEILDRLDEVVAGIEALDARIDQICEGVPVC